MSGDFPRVAPSDTVESRLLAFIRGELVSAGTSVEPDDDLLSDGLLDSVAVLRLATWVAREFEFEIKPADFVIENFRTVKILSAYVRRAAQLEE